MSFRSYSHELNLILMGSSTCQFLSQNRRIRVPKEDDGDTHDISRVPTYVFEPSLDALDDATDRTGVLSALFALEYDARMSDDGHWMASRQKHITED